MNTKVILNKDLSTLGEEGDVKHVARGYARNFLFPRGIAVPFNERTQKMFEARKDEIEARKVEKRKDAAGLKERIEALEVTIVMQVGGNGKLYGAVTTQTVVDELSKHGFAIERKKIEIPGNSIKSAGKHKVVIKLYDNTSAELSITIEAQQAKAPEKSAATKKRHRHDEVAAEAEVTAEAVSIAETGEVAAGTEAVAGDAEGTVAEAAPSEVAETVVEAAPSVVAEVGVAADGEPAGETASVSESAEV
jgi:large subunit ribosomal protein L9